MFIDGRLRFPWEKPPHGYPINWFDPLCNGLVADFLFTEGHGRRLIDGVHGLKLDWSITTAEPVWRGAASDINPQTTADSRKSPRLGPSVAFPGTASHEFIAPVDTYPPIQFVRRMSFEIWIFDNGTGGIPLIMAPLNTHWGLLHSGTSWLFRINSAEDAADTGAFTGFNPVQRWQHVVGTFDLDDPNPTQKIYRDGLLRGTRNTAVTIGAHTSSSRLTIGGAIAGFGATAHVALVRLWKRRLHPEEVWTLYQYPFRFYEGLYRRRVFVESLSRQARVPVDWAGAFRRQANVPTDWAGTLGTRQTFIPVEWQSQTGARRALIPVEWLAGLSRKATIPVEWFDTIRRSALIPTDWAGTAATRQALIPIVWAGVSRPRQAFMPAEWAGLDPHLLLHRWNVIQPLSSPLLHIWDIVSDMLDSGFPIQHVWSVFEQLAAVTHRWNVTPDVVTPFSDDVQEPTAEGDKTP